MNVTYYNFQVNREIKPLNLFFFLTFYLGVTETKQTDKNNEIKLLIII